MTKARGPNAVDRRLWEELLAALDEALHEQRRRPLARIAEREEQEADEALREVAAFPSRSCAALERGAGLRAESCLAGAGCVVEDECPLIHGRGSAGIRGSALGLLVAALVARWRRPLPPAPAHSLADLRPLVEMLLARSGRVTAESPPRARTALLVLDVAVRRGGPLGATGPFLTGQELEQVAAFVPPGSGAGDARLGPVEAWIRKAVAAEAALVDVIGGRGSAAG
jgi:hypothetical protein